MTRKCRFKEFFGGEEEESEGIFHEFGFQIVEAVNDKDNYSFSNYSIGIIEDEFGDLHSIPIKDITFIKEK